jgi:hypothetical protein
MRRRCLGQDKYVHFYLPLFRIEQEKTRPESDIGAGTESDGRAESHSDVYK